MTNNEPPIEITLRALIQNMHQHYNPGFPDFDIEAAIAAMGEKSLSSAEAGGASRVVSSSDVRVVAAAFSNSDVSGDNQTSPALSSEISDNYDLTQRLEESLAYFCDEFPKANRPEIWNKPVSDHCGGITPDDLQAILSILYARPKPVSIDECVSAAKYFDYGEGIKLPEMECYRGMVKAVLDAAKAQGAQFDYE